MSKESQKSLSPISLDTLSTLSFPVAASSLDEEHIDIMLRDPLTLEALALRQVIKKRGIMNLPSCLVPRMRQELEELSKIPGLYEIVDLKITIYKENREVKKNKHKYWLNLGDNIKISCATGSAWKMKAAGYERELSLHQQIITHPGGNTYSQFGFVEDGILKCEGWIQADKDGKKKRVLKNTIVNSRESFQLDQRGVLVWTYSDYSKKQAVVVTALARRIQEPIGWRIVQVFVDALISVREAMF